MRSEADILIVGGGIHGCALALFLARAGQQVIVLEKNVVGRHASGVNAGGVRLLMREPAEIPLSLMAMQLWETLDDLLGPDLARMTEFQGGVGQIGVAVEPSEMEWCAKRNEEMAALGYDFEEPIDQDELRRLVPAVSDKCLGGIVSHRDGHANPAQSTRAFRLAAQAAGANFVEGIQVTGLEPQNSGWSVRTAEQTYRAKRVVNCAGAWASQIAGLVGDDLSVSYFAPSLMVTARMPNFIDPVVIGIDLPLSFKQTATGTVVIGGGILGDPDLPNDTSTTVVERMITSSRIVADLFPILRDAPITRTWAGLEAITPDHLPIVGPSRNATGIWHVCGFSGYGFQLAPAVGALVAASLIEHRVEPLLTPLGMDRFEQDRSVSYG